MAIFVLALTIAISWFYIRSLLKEDEPDVQHAVAPVAQARPRPVAASTAQAPSLGASPWCWSALAIVVSIAWAFPVYWMVNSAMLPTSTLESFTPTFLPFGGSFANFRAVINESFFSALGISLSVTLIAVFFCLIFAFLAAVAISRFRFRGRRRFIIAILLIQMLPAEGLFIAQYKMMSTLGLLNTSSG